MWANPNTCDNRKITASLADTSQGHNRGCATQYNFDYNVNYDDNNHNYHNNYNYLYNSEVRFLPFLKRYLIPCVYKVICVSECTALLFLLCNLNSNSFLTESLLLSKNCVKYVASQLPIAYIEGFSIIHILHFATKLQWYLIKITYSQSQRNCVSPWTKIIYSKYFLQDCS